MPLPPAQRAVVLRCFVSSAFAGFATAFKQLALVSWIGGLIAAVLAGFIALSWRTGRFSQRAAALAVGLLVAIGIVSFLLGMLTAALTHR